MRCYALFTLTRGLNFWWAAAIVGGVCIRLLTHAKGNGVWGVYAMALLGVVPCLLLHLKRDPDSGFWQAAWVTSTFFGFGHTSNSGEAWIGIFAAGAIGFIFCVSVKLTGSAWWAIGCHAAWDWGETYFYGTADSGFVAPGHFLTTSPAGGNPGVEWRGGRTRGQPAGRRDHLVAAGSVAGCIWASSGAASSHGRGATGELGMVA